MGSPEFPLWKKCMLEMGGTYAITLFGPATIMVGFLVPGLDGLSRLFFDALVPGVTLATCITALAKYSGSHVNPAITVTFTSTGSFSRSAILPYMVFQLVGGLLAGLTLRLVFDSQVPSASLGSNMIAVGVTSVQAIVLEVAGTILLCLVVLGAVTFIGAIWRQGVVCGVTLSLLIFFLGPISGGSFNPVRSLGPALFAGYLDGLYVYLITPIVGATLAGLLFQALRRRSKKSSP